MQIILNILSNAIKFTIKGGIVIKTKQRENNAFITIKDTGVGIKSEDIPKLFAEFCTISEHQPMNPNGTGLGLYLSRNLAQLMKGNITVKSVYGKGTKFTIQLPLDEECKDADKSISNENHSIKENIGLGVDSNETIILSDNNMKPLITRRSENSTTLCSRSLSDNFKEKVTVLVVDDNVINSFVICKMLHNYSIKADKALNGKEAIELVKVHNEKPYALILMDINMPVMSGTEV